MGVGLAVVVVEDHDGGHHGARHHEHDDIEICSYTVIILGRSQMSYRSPINGVALVTGSMSPTIVLNSTMASRRLTPCGHGK